MIKSTPESLRKAQIYNVKRCTPAFNYMETEKERDNKPKRKKRPTGKIDLFA